MSLSPRPERLTITICFSLAGRQFRYGGDRMGAFKRRNDAFDFGKQFDRLDRFSIGCRSEFDPAANRVGSLIPGPPPDSRARPRSNGFGDLARSFCST